MDRNSLPARFSSETSIGFPEKDILENFQFPNKLSEMNKKIKRIDSASLNFKILSDVYCLVVICKQHKRIVVQNYENKFYFLPFAWIDKGNVEFDKVIRNLLKKIKLNSQSLSQFISDYLIYKKNSNFSENRL